MRWLVDPNELDNEQTAILDSICKGDGNILVNGFPGSGKTVLMVYSVVRLHTLYPNKSIIVVEYTHALIKMIKAALEQSRITDVPVVTIYDFRKNYARRMWDYIVCDEVQDMTPSWLRELKSQAGRVIVGGDRNQSIYPMIGRERTLSRDDIEDVLSPRINNLHIIHRLSNSIRTAVEKFMPEMNIMDGRISMNRQDIAIRLWRCKNESDEVGRTFMDAMQVINTEKTAAVLVPSHNWVEKFANRILALENKPRWMKTFVQKGRYRETDYDDMNAHLEKNGVPLQYVANGFGDLGAEKRKILLITYHSAKGLDFDNVYMPFCSQSVYDGTLNSIFGQYLGDNEIGDFKRRLFMVAMTRSRRNLILTYTGQANELIESFRDGRIGQAGRLLCNFHDYTTNSNQSELPLFGGNGAPQSTSSSNPFF